MHCMVHRTKYDRCYRVRYVPLEWKMYCAMGLFTGASNRFSVEPSKIDDTKSGYYDYMNRWRFEWDIKKKCAKYTFCGAIRRFSLPHPA